jgi:menaquinone-9 beta-reductase
MQATLTPAAAAGRTWDCAVIGAGPAGSLAAREVARRGASVLLLDRAAFPRYKVCGCCLNPRSLGVLGRVGLGSLVGQLGGVPLNRLRLGAGRARAGVPLPVGVAVSRTAFDAALVREAVAAGAAFLPQATASLEQPHAGERSHVSGPMLREDGGWLPATSAPPFSASGRSRGSARRVVQIRHPEGTVATEAHVVVVATGLGGRVEDGEAAWEPGSRIGAGVIVNDAPTEYGPHVIHMACEADGYVGLVRLEDDRLDVAAALDPAAVRAAGGPGPLASQILAAAGFAPIPGLEIAPWKGTPHLTRSAPNLGGERLFRLGDAAGYVEPFTGEGMAWALAGATLVAPLVGEAIRQWDAGLLRRWEADYRRAVTRRQLVCRMTAAVLRRPGPTRALVRLLAVAPALAGPAFRFMYRA